MHYQLPILEDRIVKAFCLRIKDCLCPSRQRFNCGHKAKIKVLTRKPVGHHPKRWQNYRARGSKLDLEVGVLKRMEVE